MYCPACGNDTTKVIDSRVAADGLSIRRRRVCGQCEFRFSTYEEMEVLNVVIVKRDGKKEAYSRDKLKKGLQRALEKRPVAPDDVKQVVSKIERDIQLLRKSEVASEQVGRLVMKHLRTLDQVAYIRYASVYESFDDVRMFSEELDKLMRRRRVRKKQ